MQPSTLSMRSWWGSWPETWASHRCVGGGGAWRCVGVTPSDGCVVVWACELVGRVGAWVRGPFRVTGVWGPLNIGCVYSLWPSAG
jgi:hypothetical protein